MKQEKKIFQRIQTWFLHPERKEPKSFTKAEQMAALGEILFVVLLILNKLTSLYDAVYAALFLLVILLELPELVMLIRSFRKK